MKVNIYCSDPYDLWATAIGVSIKRSYYQGVLLGKAGAVMVSVCDLLFPRLMRRLFFIPKCNYPILSAHAYLTAIIEEPFDSDIEVALKDFASQVATDSRMMAWGLGFPWMSKNGLYGPDLPFVTHTPYVMEALLALAERPLAHDEAMAMFQGTWDFLESLWTMHEDDTWLALSYAPVEESRIVVNANSYAAFAYALHAIHGQPNVRHAARDKSLRLTRWVVGQQGGDGSWCYYSDRGPGNFIDGFHSCFIVKNLLKVKGLLSEAEPIVDAAIERGWLYIRNNLFDARAGLCRRFARRSHRDPFRWDLYDQAEYLGLLVDFGLFDEASEFAARVEKRFMKGPHWYCRIDVFGRRWGKDFMRWGIAPFLYHRARLDKAQRTA